MLHKYLKYLVLTLLIIPIITSCEDDEDYSVLQNDCIKRSIGPNLVGLDIEFAYAMALPKVEGKILSAEVQASISGASGTWMENKSFHSNSSGDDVGVVIGKPSITSGANTSVEFSVDTCAATLRYYYQIPEEARGKDVSFIFTVKASNGETASYKMGTYRISRMDMRLDMNVKDGNACYISIADMAAYTAAEAAANSDKIDLIYLYRNISTVTFAHALVAPAADQVYLPGINLPAGVNRNTLIRKTWGLRDRHLDRTKYGIYVDDPDFQTIDLTGMPNYAINLKAEAGIWLETQDGKYRAYLYINKVDNTNKSAVISMKRYTMK